MHRVVEYIDQHIDERLDLETLAGVAHFSPFHFRRLFSAWMGETLGDYLRHLGPYGDPISQFWQQTVYPWMLTHNLLGEPRYGISHDDPSITTEKKCRYDACVEIAPDSAPPGKALKTVIPGGKYASLQFKGTIPEIGVAWSSILRDWLPSSGLQLDTRPCFEYYPTDSTFDAATGVFDCEICIPVVPL